jgi:hypothetical protein
MFYNFFLSITILRLTGSRPLNVISSLHYTTRYSINFNGRKTADHSFIDILIIKEVVAFALLGCYAKQVGGKLPKFRDSSEHL